ncbi:MAG: Methyltransferase, FkbM family [Nitrospira sp.]
MSQSAVSLKSLVRRLCRSIGFDVYRVGTGKVPGFERTRLAQLLRQARRSLSPATVIDVGAAYGAFAEECVTVFPESRYLLIEPLVEYRQALQEVEKRHPSMLHIRAAAASRAGDIVIYVHPDLVGSSVMRERETGTDVNGVPRTVPAVTIDGVIRETCVKGPFLLKIDVQGAELDVLRGAAEALNETEYVLCEASLFKFFESGPELIEVLSYMKSHGFVPYDLGNLQYRPLDNALSQVDVAFVRETGDFRRHHFYATPAQRAMQDRDIRAHLNKVLMSGR